MDRLNSGAAAPSFCLPDSDENRICLEDFRGRWVVLYFYPKDNTPGCTLEAIHFSQQVDTLSDLNAVVVGVSPDSAKSHCGFRDKHQLKVILLSDPEHQVLEQYGVWARKSLYGRGFFGVERSTFLIDPEGKLKFVWNKVKVPGHIQAVIEKLQEQSR